MSREIMLMSVALTVIQAAWKAFSVWGRIARRS